MLEPDSVPFEFLGQFLGPFEGAVRDHDVLHAVAQEVLGGELGHFACAQKHDVFPVQVAEDLLGKLDRGGADGNRPLRQSGLRTDPLRDGDRLLDQFVQDRAGGLGLKSNIEGILELAQDLGLAEDQGVQARSNPEGVAHALGIGIDVE